MRRYKSELISMPRPQPRDIVRARKTWRKKLQKLNPTITVTFDHGFCNIDGPDGFLAHFSSATFPFLPRPDAQERATHKQTKKPEPPKRKTYHHDFDYSW
jgi:hypothetical protein